MAEKGRSRRSSRTGHAGPNGLRPSAWKGGIPLPIGEGSGEGAVPPPQKMFRIFFAENAIF